MQSKRHKIGMLLTAFWLAFTVYLVFRARAQISGLELNELGDFFAGAFAPLAFLWLVLGYLQQGEELRLSTAALNLQVKEFRKSVEQQGNLVELQRQQVENEKLAISEERLRRNRDAMPNIAYESFGATYQGTGRTTFTFNMSNSGNIALRLYVEARHQLGLIESVFKTTLLDRGAKFDAKITVANPSLIEGCVLELRYSDLLDNEFFDRYLITLAHGTEKTTPTLTKLSPN